MKNRVTAYETYDAMSRAAGDLMFSVLRENPEAALVIATGHSPLGAYHHLVRRVREEGLDVSRALWIKLDEWAGLPPEDPATCEYFIRKELLEPLSIPEDRYLAFRAQAPDLDAECARIEAAYSALPQIDLVILGIGMNGHLGLNEPGPELMAYAHTTLLDGKTKTHAMLSQAGGMVSRGITLGMADLFRGKQILLLADGKEKERGLDAYLSGTVTTQVPVSLLQLHPNCLCMVNRESFPGREF